MKHLVLMALLLATIIAGCSDSDTTATGSSDGVTGDLYGTVSLVDYRGRYIGDRSGVLIQCEGTSFSAVSASDGSWVIHNLPTRNLSISFSKDGFSTFKITSYQFIGGGAQRIGTTELWQPCRFSITIDGFIIPRPDTTITFDSAGGHFTNHIVRGGSIYAHTSDDAPDSIYLNVYYLFGRSESMNPIDPSSYVLRTGAITPQPNKSVGSVNFSSNLSYASFSNFTPGERVYVKAFPFINVTQYYDVRSGTSITSGGYGKESNVLSAVLQ